MTDSTSDLPYSSQDIRRRGELLQFSWKRDPSVIRAGVLCHCGYEPVVGTIHHYTMARLDSRLHLCHNTWPGKGKLQVRALRLLSKHRYESRYR